MMASAPYTKADHRCAGRYRPLLGGDSRKRPAPCLRAAADWSRHWGLHLRRSGRAGIGL